MLISRPKQQDPDRGAPTGRPRRKLIFFGGKRPFLGGELLIVFVLLEVYGELRKLADTRYATALSHAQDILRFERFLHLDVELGMNRWLTEHRLPERIASEWYQHTHTWFTIAILLWCYLSGSSIYRPARNSLILINLVGLAIFFAVPVMPPRLIPDAGYIDTVADAGYGVTHSDPITMSPAQYAAMPSLHMAWSLWVMIVAFLLLRRYRVKWLTIIHPAMTGIVIMATANHYLMDVVAGAAVAVASFVAVGLVWAGEGTPYFGGQLIRRNRVAARAQPVIHEPSPSIPATAKPKANAGATAAASAGATASASASATASAEAAASGRSGSNGVGVVRSASPGPGPGDQGPAGQDDGDLGQDVPGPGAQQVQG